MKKIPGSGSIVDRLDEARLTINYQNLLNPSQYEAASAVEGAYLIIAGAGTGKTRTLVYRVARLVELGVEPQSVLLLTFTRKAAREMLTRAELLLDDRCSKIRGGTFHSFANLTLRKYGKAIGLDPAFTILDQGDSEDVVNLVRSQLGIAGRDKKRFPNKRTLHKIYSLAVNTERNIYEIVDEEYPHFADELDAIIDIEKVYRSYKKKNNLLDYDDLLVYLRTFLFEQSPAAKSLLSGINFVMVDEYQDTNSIQADIVAGLAQEKKNVMVVGDDSQSIYSFRGANFKNIIRFPNLFDDVKVITLEENYRSTQSILDFANRINEGMIEKYEKDLYTHSTGGELPLIIAAKNENLQSQFVVDKILELNEEGISLNDMAVLFRSSFFSFDLEIELAKANIPFIKVGGMKFVETAHVKDLLALLRIVQNPNDIVSWLRVLMLHDGIGQKTAQKIVDLIDSGTIRLNSPETAFKKHRIKDHVIILFDRLNKMRGSKGMPSEIAQMALEYYSPIFKETYDDFNKRKKDLDIFLNITGNYRSLDSLLSDMAIEPPIDSVIGTGDEDREEELVTLSTIHSAKGLEWNTVFIIHALDGFFPMNRIANNIEQLEEERRLMYVAATRAKRHLFVSYPMNIYDRETGTTLSKPSRFLKGIDASLAEGYFFDGEF